MVRICTPELSGMKVRVSESVVKRRRREKTAHKLFGAFRSVREPQVMESAEAQNFVKLTGSRN